MTDYIAVLLAQQEEQEQGEAPELETGPLTVWLEENTRPAEAAAARRGVEQDEAGACAGPGAVIGNRYAPEAPVGDSGGRPSDRGAKQWADGLQTAGAVETAGKTGEALVGHHASQALFVAADTAVEFPGPAGAHHRIPERARGGLARRSGAQEHGAGVERRNGEAGGDGGAVRRSGGHSGGGRGAGPAVSPGRPAV